MTELRLLAALCIGILLGYFLGWHERREASHEPQD